MINDTYFIKIRFFHIQKKILKKMENGGCFDTMFKGELKRFILNLRVLRFSTVLSWLRLFNKIKVRKGNLANATNGLKYFLLGLKGYLMETFWWLGGGH